MSDGRRKVAARESTGRKTYPAAPAGFALVRVRASGLLPRKPAVLPEVVLYAPERHVASDSAIHRRVSCRDRLTVHDCPRARRREARATAGPHADWSLTAGPRWRLTYVSVFTWGVRAGVRRVPLAHLVRPRR